MSHTLDASAVSEDVVLPVGPTRESLATRTSILAATFTFLAILSIFLELPKSWSLSAAVLGIASAVTPGVMVAPTQIAWAERWQSYFAAVAALVVVILGPTTAAPVLAVPFVVPLAQAWAGVQDIHCRWPVPMAVCLAWLVAAPAPSSLMALQVSGALCMAAFAATEVIRDHRAPKNTSNRAPVTILEMLSLIHI